MWFLFFYFFDFRVIGQFCLHGYFSSLNAPKVPNVLKFTPLVFQCAKRARPGKTAQKGMRIVNVVIFVRVYKNLNEEVATACFSYVVPKMNMFPCLFWLCFRSS